MTPKPSDLVRERPQCPTPTKQVFRSKAAARRYQRSMRLPAGSKDRLHPYWCVAGHWHLTHQDPETQAQTALRIQRMRRFQRQAGDGS